MKTLTKEQEAYIQEKLSNFSRYAVIKFHEEDRVEIIHKTGDFFGAVSVCAKSWKAMGKDSAMLYINPYYSLYLKEASWNTQKYAANEVEKEYKTI